MPPKKKATKTKQQNGDEVNPQTEKPKQEKAPAIEANKEPTKTNAVKYQQPKKTQVKTPKAPEPQIKQHNSQVVTVKKINTEQQPNLSEAELLRRRKLRFNGVVGTQLTSEQAQKVKAARLQKFGGKLQTTKQQLEKRKEKFFSNPNIVNDEEPQNLNKRKEKFGGLAEVDEDKSNLQERKKKFGIKQVGGLDDLIKSDKEKNKHRHDHKRGRSFNNYGNNGKPYKKFNR